MLPDWTTVSSLSAATVCAFAAVQGVAAALAGLLAWVLLVELELSPPKARAPATPPTTSAIAAASAMPAMPMRPAGAGAGAGAWARALGGASPSSGPSSAARRSSIPVSMRFRAAGMSTSGNNSGTATSCIQSHSVLPVKPVHFHGRT